MSISPELAQARQYRRRILSLASGDREKAARRIVDKWPAKQIPYKNEPRMIPATDLLGNLAHILAVERRLHDIYLAQGVKYHDVEYCDYSGLADKLSRDDWGRLFAAQRQRIKEYCWSRFTWHWRRRNLGPPPRGLSPKEYRRRLAALYGGGDD